MDWTQSCTTQDIVRLDELTEFFVSLASETGTRQHATGDREPET